MKKLVLVFVVLAVIAGVAIAMLSLNKPSLNRDDLRKALLDVKTIHITGGSPFMNAPAGSIQSSEKWINANPFIEYEDMKLIDEKTNTIKGHMTVFDDGEKHIMYYYNPERGERVTILNSIHNTGFLGIALFHFSDPMKPGSEPEIEASGYTNIGGRKMILVETFMGGKAYVDPKTKLTSEYTYSPGSNDGVPLPEITMKFEYNKTPPPGTIDWQPPEGVEVIDKR